MPSRKYAITTEIPPNELTNDVFNGHVNGDQARASAAAGPADHSKKDEHYPLYLDEEGVGTKHEAASGVHTGAMAGGPDVNIRVEIDQHDGEGKTRGMGSVSRR